MSKGKKTELSDANTSQKALREHACPPIDGFLPPLPGRKEEDKGWIALDNDFCFSHHSSHGSPIEAGATNERFDPNSVAYPKSGARLDVLLRKAIRGLRLPKDGGKNDTGRRGGNSTDVQSAPRQAGAEPTGDTKSRYCSDANCPQRRPEMEPKAPKKKQKRGPACAAEDLFCVPQPQVDRLKSILQMSKGGAILVTGYRGVGKSSVANRAIGSLMDAPLASEKPERHVSEAAPSLSASLLLWALPLALTVLTSSTCGWPNELAYITIAGICVASSICISNLYIHPIPLPKYVVSLLLTVLSNPTPGAFRSTFRKALHFLWVLLKHLAPVATVATLVITAWALHSTLLGSRETLCSTPASCLCFLLVQLLLPPSLYLRLWLRLRPRHPFGQTQLVPIRINLSSNREPLALTDIMLRELYERTMTGRLPGLSKRLVRSAYRRSRGTTTETQEIKAGLEQRTVALAASLGSKVEYAPHPYTLHDAQHDIHRILRRAKRRGYTIVFIFDEVDKLLPHQPEPSEEFAQKRLTDVQSLVSHLKFLLTESDAFHIFLAGKNVDDSWKEDQNKGEGIFESIFVHNIYIPSTMSAEYHAALGPHSWLLTEFLQCFQDAEFMTAFKQATDKADNKNSISIFFEETKSAILTSIYSILLAELGIRKSDWTYNTGLIVLPHLSATQLRGLLKRTVDDLGRNGDVLNATSYPWYLKAYVRCMHQCMHSCVATLEPWQATIRSAYSPGQVQVPTERRCMRIRYILQYLTFKGRGIPRKILREFYGLIATPHEVRRRTKYWEDRGGPEYVLSLPRHLMHKIKFFANIVHRLEEHSDAFASLDDKGRVALFHIVDHILKFYQTGFDWADMENASFMTQREELFPSRELVALVLHVLEDVIVEKVERRESKYMLIPRIKHDLAKLFLEFGPEQIELRFTKAEFAKEIRELSQALHEVEGVPSEERLRSIRVQIRLAKIYELLGDVPSAILLYNQALRWARMDLERASERGAEVLAHLDSGKHYQLSRTMRGLSAVTLQNYTSAMAEIFIRLGYVHELCKDLSSAMAMYRSAYALIESMEGRQADEALTNPDHNAESDIGAALRQFRYLGEPLEAEGAVQRPEGRSLALNLMAICSEKGWHRGVANRLLLHNLELLRQAGDYYSFVDQLIFTGELCARRRDFRSAAFAYLTAHSWIASFPRCVSSADRCNPEVQTSVKARLYEYLGDIWVAFGSRFFEEYYGVRWGARPVTATVGNAPTREADALEAVRSPVFFDNLLEGSGPEYFLTEAAALYMNNGHRPRVIDVYLKKIDVRATQFLRAAADQPEAAARLAEAKARLAEAKAGLAEATARLAEATARLAKAEARRSYDPARAGAAAQEATVARLAEEAARRDLDAALGEATARGADAAAFANPRWWKRQVKLDGEGLRTWQRFWNGVEKVAAGLQDPGPASGGGGGSEVWDKRRFGHLLMRVGDFIHQAALVGYSGCFLPKSASGTSGSGRQETEVGNRFDKWQKHFFSDPKVGGSLKEVLSDRAKAQDSDVSNAAGIPRGLKRLFRILIDPKSDDSGSPESHVLLAGLTLPRFGQDSLLWNLACRDWKGVADLPTGKPEDSQAGDVADPSKVNQENLRGTEDDLLLGGLLATLRGAGGPGPEEPDASKEPVLKSVAALALSERALLGAYGCLSTNVNDIETAKCCHAIGSLYLTCISLLLRTKRTDKTNPEHLLYHYSMLHTAAKRFLHAAIEIYEEEETNHRCSRVTHACSHKAVADLMLIHSEVMTLLRNESSAVPPRLLVADAFATDGIWSGLLARDETRTRVNRYLEVFRGHDGVVDAADARRQAAAAYRSANAQYAAEIAECWKGYRLPNDVSVLHHNLMDTKIHYDIVTGLGQRFSQCPHCPEDLRQRFAVASASLMEQSRALTVSVASARPRASDRAVWLTDVRRDFELCSEMSPGIPLLSLSENGDLSWADGPGKDPTGTSCRDCEGREKPSQCFRRMSAQYYSWMGVPPITPPAPS